MRSASQNWSSQKDGEMPNIWKIIWSLQYWFLKIKHLFNKSWIIKNRSEINETTATRHIHRRFGMPEDEIEKILDELFEENMIKKIELDVNMIMHWMY